MRCWTAMAMGLLLHFVTGCLTSADETEGWIDDADLEQVGLEELTEELDLERVSPDLDDEALCTSLANRQARCRGGFLAADGCVERFACSRRMWRPDAVDAVYACIEEASCELEDPATTCLQTVAAELEPSAAQRRAEQAIAELDADCPGVLEVAPAQGDRVYDTITACIETEDSCDEVGSCVVVSLETLADQLCGPPLETL